jgi:hypothetical protein
MSQTHVIKLPLHQLEAHQKRTLDKKLYAHGLIYNATLRVLLERIDKYHEECQKRGLESKDWKKKNTLKRKNDLSKFETIRLAHSYKNNTINYLLDGLTVNQTASRAWLHCQDYLKYKKNKPRFKNPRKLKMVTGSGNRQNLRLVFLKDSYGQCAKSAKWVNKDLASVQNTEDLKQVILGWSGRDTPHRKYSRLRVDWLKLPQVRREHVVKLLQEGKLAQAGIKRELIRGEYKYYALLTFNALPYRQELVKQPTDVIAIDTGPAQSKGVDSNGQAHHFKPADDQVISYKRVEKLIKQKQRALERSLRINNPDAYEENGVLKKGAKLNNWSKNAIRLRDDLHELYRKRRVLQKENILKTVKQITKEYQTVVMEKVSYRAWFSRYSKAMCLFTPGLFQKLLQNELSLREGELKLLPLQYAFSQTCYCSVKKKKPLSQREHACYNKTCPTKNKTYDRDLFSSLLMLSVKENDLDLKTYQSSDWFDSLSQLERTTIETRLKRLALNGKSHPVSTLTRKPPTSNKTISQKDTCFS